MKALLFIILYGSGFVGVKLGFPYANVPSFLLARFGLTILVMGGLAVLIKASWPRSRKEIFHISVAGLLMGGGFSLCLWTSLALGLSPGISALIIALQPLLVSVLSFLFMHKRITRLQWGGVSLGLLGTLLIVLHKMGHAPHEHVALLFSFLGLLGITLSGLYQKQFCSQMNIFSGSVIQSGVSVVLMVLVLPLYGGFHIEWTHNFIIALLWMGLIVSVSATSLWYLLLRTGEAYQVASLFYLMPVVAVVMAYFMFGETLTINEMFGMVIVLTGVVLVNIKRKQHPRTITCNTSCT